MDKLLSKEEVKDTIEKDIVKILVDAKAFPITQKIADDLKISKIGGFVRLTKEELKDIGFNPVTAANIVGRAQKFKDAVPSSGSTLQSSQVGPYGDAVPANLGHADMVQNLLVNANAQISAFLNALRNAKLECNNKLLKLEQACDFKFFRIFVSGIFIREHYDNLYKIIFERLINMGQSSDYVLIGTPGIGKTYFAYFFLWKLITENHSFVFEPWREKDGPRLAWVYFGEEEIKPYGKKSDSSMKGQLLQVNSQMLALQYETNYKVLHIIDGHTPNESPFQRVLVCSPQPGYYKDIRSKLNASLLYMPVWSEHEILECRPLLYKDLDEKIVKQMVARWGGVPRYVFQTLDSEIKKFSNLSNSVDAAVQSLNNDLDMMIDVCKVSGLNKWLYSLSEPDPNHILHIKVDLEPAQSYDQYAHYSMAFASKYVFDRLYRNFREEDKQAIYNELDKNLNSKGGLTSGIRNILEKFANDYISRGALFDKEKRNVFDDECLLIQGVNKRMSIVKKCVVISKVLSAQSGASELQEYFNNNQQPFGTVTDSGWIYFETASGHPTFDGLAVQINANKPIEAVFFNATAGKTHTCKLPNEFIDYLKFFSNQPHYCLAYVLPKKMFDEFKLSSFSYDVPDAEKYIQRLACFKIKITSQEISHPIALA